MGLGELQNLGNVKNGQDWELDSLVDGSLSSHNSMVDEMMEKILDDESLTEYNYHGKGFSSPEAVVVSELSSWSEEDFHNSFEGHSYSTCLTDDSLLFPTKNYAPMNVNINDCDINLGSLDHSNLLKLAALNMESSSITPLNGPTFYDPSSLCYMSQSPDSPTPTSYLAQNSPSHNVSTMQSNSQLLYGNHSPYHSCQLPFQQVMQVSAPRSTSDECSTILLNGDFKSAQHSSVPHLGHSYSENSFFIPNVTSRGFNETTNGMDLHQCNECVERDKSNNNSSTLMRDFKKSSSTNNQYTFQLESNFHHDKYSNVSRNFDHSKRTHLNKFHVPDSNPRNETDFILCHNNNNELPSKQIAFPRNNYCDDQSFHYKYKQHSNPCNVPHIPCDPTFPSLNRNLLPPPVNTAAGGSAWTLQPEVNMMPYCEHPGMAGPYVYNLRAAR